MRILCATGADSSAPFLETSGKDAIREAESGSALAVCSEEGDGVKT